jgi:hypothetical protein
MSRSGGLAHLNLNVTEVDRVVLLDQPLVERRQVDSRPEALQRATHAAVAAVRNAGSVSATGLVVAESHALERGQLQPLPMY